MNNDLISREDLKRKLQYVYSCEYIGSKSKEGIVSDIIDNIDNALAVESNQWIPIKTRPLTEEEKEIYPDYTFIYDCSMPEDGEEVLITTKYGVCTDIYCWDDCGCYFECHCDDGEVLAWKRFPQPYKEGDDL